MEIAIRSTGYAENAEKWLILIISIAPTAAHEWRDDGMNDTEFENTLKNAVRVCIGDDNDLIRRGDALNAIREVCRIGCLPSSALTRKEQREVVLLDTLQAVRTVKKAAVPTVDPESLRPTAHWIKRGYVCGENEYECSACHQTEWRTSASRMKYCMFCGKRMVNAND